MAPPRRRLVGVSTKMYFSTTQTTNYLQSCLPLSTLASDLDVEIFIIPDFLSIPAAAQILSTSTSTNTTITTTPNSPSISPSQIRLGAQDCHWDDHGAHTGSISPSVLYSFGVSIVELGHAERRRDFAESDSDVLRKAVAAERNSLTPLICIGEKSRAADVSDAVADCLPQFLPVLKATKGEVVLAYEPVWAIGAERPADPEYVLRVTREIRRVCEEVGRGDMVRILYGGSAGPGTFKAIEEGVDGLFLGRFAHDIKNFELVIKEVARGN